MGRKAASKRRKKSRHRKSTAARRHAARTDERGQPARPERGDAFPIAAIGASAGGLDGLERFLNALPPAIVTIDEDGVVEIFNPAAERMFGYAAAEVIGKDVSLLMPSPYRENHSAYLDHYHRTGETRVIGQARELTGRRKDGAEFPLRLSVGKVGGFGLYTGILHDISHERALQQEVVRIATLEQSRIGQELHDGVQQELMGIGLLAEQLSDALRARGPGPEVDLAAKIASGVADTNRHIRELSRGLVPHLVDGSGLNTALGELARNIEERHKVECQFDAPEVFALDDGVVATHLYRIAQEAVSNALKHARPASVSISLEKDEREARLKVEDDGVGIGPPASRNNGLGLRIMEHRCALIGGALTVAPRDGGGTTVVCAVPRERLESSAANA